MGIRYCLRGCYRRRFGSVRKLSFFCNRIKYVEVMLAKKIKLWEIKYLPSAILNYWSIKRKGILLGKKTKIYGRILIKGKGIISIGNGCTINSSMDANPIGGDSHVVFYAKTDAVIEIGNNCGLSNCAIVAFKRIVIEDNVYIGGSTKIYDTDFHDLDVTGRLAGNKDNIKTSPVRICKGAFIGAHSIILKGTTIGENAVIGAGSVVTKDVPAEEVWAGNPAHKIR